MVVSLEETVDDGKRRVTTFKLSRGGRVEKANLENLGRNVV